MILNVNDLQAEIARNGLSLPKLADIIGIDKKTMYSRIKGETAFKRPEIVKISETLHLTQEQILHIFFSDMVF